MAAFDLTITVGRMLGGAVSGGMVDSFGPQAGLAILACLAALVAWLAAGARDSGPRTKK